MRKSRITLPATAKGQRLLTPRLILSFRRGISTRIKTLLYEERLTLEGAKKRLIGESRRGPEQLDLGLREAAYADALRRTRDRLTALRRRLSP